MSAFRHDVKLQAKHGFYYAYLLISAAYIVFLQFLPKGHQESVNVVLTFSDPSVLGFFFIGGLVLLEKGQNILDSLFVTPLRPEEYILSKTASLSLLSLVSSYLIHSSVFGFGTNAVLFLSGVLLTSFFFTQIGLGLAVRCVTLNGFFFLSTLCTLVFILPLFETVGLWKSPLFYLLPSKASLLLLEAAFHPLGKWELAYCLFLLLLWNGAAFLWTRHSVRTFITFKLGGGEKR
ncbi:MULTISPECIES: fluoroquinolone export ABC transporter permease subunit [Bacillus]|uniref:fluoroquinolone export ABC transporter permease subunit n=1 Tax=Bacillus TaxID=1386 RepID=UPI0003FB61CF|nr:MULTISPECIES: ABC transporter permease [Bacillus]